jgi:hypothetical protein
MSRHIVAYRCLQCNKILHPTQVLDKGLVVDTPSAWYYEHLPRHKLFEMDYIGAPIREIWHAVVPEFELEMNRAPSAARRPNATERESV